MNIRHRDTDLDQKLQEVLSPAHAPSSLVPTVLNRIEEAPSTGPDTAQASIGTRRFRTHFTRWPALTAAAIAAALLLALGLSSSRIDVSRTGAWAEDLTRQIRAIFNLPLDPSSEPENYYYVPGLGIIPLGSDARYLPEPLVIEVEDFRLEVHGLLLERKEATLVYTLAAGSPPITQPGESPYDARPRAEHRELELIVRPSHETASDDEASPPTRFVIDTAVQWRVHRWPADGWPDDKLLEAPSVELTLFRRAGDSGERRDEAAPLTTQRSPLVSTSKGTAFDAKGPVFVSRNGVDLRMLYHRGSSGRAALRLDWPGVPEVDEVRIEVGDEPNFFFSDVLFEPPLAWVSLTDASGTQKSLLGTVHHGIHGLTLGKEAWESSGDRSSVHGLLPLTLVYAIDAHETDALRLKIETLARVYDMHDDMADHHGPRDIARVDVALPGAPTLSDAPTGQAVTPANWSFPGDQPGSFPVDIPITLHGHDLVVTDGMLLAQQSLGYYSMPLDLFVRVIARNPRPGWHLRSIDNGEPCSTITRLLGQRWGRSFVGAAQYRPGDAAVPDFAVALWQRRQREELPIPETVTLCLAKPAFEIDGPWSFDIPDQDPNLSR